MSLRIARADAATHTGPVRSRNEDSLVQRPELGLWAVADGAGGHGAGDVASQAVATALQALHAPPGQVVAAARQALLAVNTALHAEGLATRRTIATTVVALVLGEAGADLLWAGDSRAYLLRDGRLQALTRDHSLVQELLEAGEIAEDEVEEHPQGNIILRAVGAEAALALDLVQCPLRAGDRLLLCSDGLYRALPRAELTRLLAAGGAAGLVAAALAQQPRDNVTAVVVAVAD
jgi:protein phosphatase/serine/threonine-protein phosphatase Stp1